MSKHDKPRLGVGIDTGGTYTDAVLMDLDDKTVVGAAKTPTTHEDLKRGVALALDEVLRDVAVDDVELVAVSTTLATNAVLEDRGASVGFIAIGHDQPLNLPVLAQHYVNGGHSLGGTELEPLDLEVLMEGVVVMKRSGVDTYAVCSIMSMENPTHEDVAAKAISMIDPKPVFCSHYTSSEAGFKDRAATTVLNARLMPTMQRFTDGVSRSMERLGLTCESRIIRGDATHIPMLEGPMQAVSTVGSGPAATTWYGMVAGKLADALVVDVGGTSTDVTLLQNGAPVLSRAGSRIGEWDTHIQAVEMYTAAIGGDSHAAIGRAGQLKVGPRRALPLCMAGDKLPDPMQWLGADMDGKCLMLAHDSLEGLSQEVAENPIVQFLKENGPATPEKVRQALRFSSPDMERRLEHLGRKLAVLECGFTPTDALHALGRLAMKDASHSLAGARALGNVLKIKGEEVCDIVIGRAQEAIEDAILRYMLVHEAGHNMAGILERRREFKRLGMRFSIDLPMVGVGAAASLLLPGVAENLSTEVVFPDYFQVGNALGALLLASDPKAIVEHS